MHDLTCNTLKLYGWFCCGRVVVMDRFLRLNMSFLSCKSLRIVLAIAWLCGLIFGALSALVCDGVSVISAYSAIKSTPSFWAMLAAMVLPVLISFVSAYFSQGLILLPVAFFKSFCFSFIWVGVLLAFCSSGWLIRCLLMFADFLSLPFLYFLWLRCSENHLTQIYDGILAFCGVTFICLLEYSFIAPFLEQLI